MKLASYKVRGRESFGAVTTEGVVDLKSRLGPRHSSVLEVLREGALDAARAAVGGVRADFPLTEVEWLSPVPAPEKILCIGINYANRNADYGDAEAPKYPSMFYRAPNSLAAHNGAILLPPESEQLDYEGEMVVIIGRRAKHLTLENATDCVAGYACGMEGSVREYQRHTTQWGMGKNFDRTGSIGPWMVTADELPRGGKGLKIESRLNGKTMQSSNTDLLMFPVAESLVYLTEGMTLEPGAIILTGTPSGVGHARKPEPVWMKPGDTIEIEVEGIGVLRNPIEDEKP